jgi:hemerythrin superfamily protein
VSVLEKVMTYVGRYAATDIRALLSEDHEVFKDLLQQMTSDESSARRVSAFGRLKPLLTAHARAEEAAVYTRMVDLKGSRDARAHGNEGFVEHSLVDVLMERLSKTDLAGTDAWKAHAKVLKEMLEHHIAEEEHEVYEELGEHFSGEQRDAIGADFLARKEELLAGAKSMHTR